MVGGSRNLPLVLLRWVSMVMQLLSLEGKYSSLVDTAVMVIVYHNSLFSFNVDTFNWKELSPTSPHHGPMMKRYCGMVAVQFEGEAYLVVIGGSNGMDNNLVLNVVLSMKVVVIVLSIVMRFIITSYHQVSIINYHEVLCS